MRVLARIKDSNFESVFNQINCKTLRIVQAGEILNECHTSSLISNWINCFKVIKPNLNSDFKVVCLKSVSDIRV